MPRDYVQRLLKRYTKDTGLVCSTPIGSRPQSFWAEVECGFLNTLQARWQYAAEAIGFGFAQGKSMLWYKPVLEGHGSIEALGLEIAEDAAATKLVRRQGLRVGLADNPFEQPLGVRTFAEVWGRQLRWARLRRVTFLPFFLLEVFTGCVFPSLAAAFAASVYGYDAVSAGVLVAALWMAAEAVLAWSAGWRLTAGRRPSSGCSATANAAVPVHHGAAHRRLRVARQRHDGEGRTRQGRLTAVPRGAPLRALRPRAEQRPAGAGSHRGALRGRGSGRCDHEALFAAARLDERLGERRLRVPPLSRDRLHEVLGICGGHATLRLGGDGRPGRRGRGGRCPGAAGLARGIAWIAASHRFQALVGASRRAGVDWDLVRADTASEDDRAEGGARHPEGARAGSGPRHRSDRRPKDDMAPARLRPARAREARRGPPLRGYSAASARRGTVRPWRPAFQQLRDQERHLDRLLGVEAAGRSRCGSGRAGPCPRWRARRPCIPCTFLPVISRWMPPGWVPSSRVDGEEACGSRP